MIPLLGHHGVTIYNAKMPNGKINYHCLWLHTSGTSTAICLVCLTSNLTHLLCQFNILMSSVFLLIYLTTIIDKAVVEHDMNKTLPHISGSCYINATLLLHGCLGPSPQEVSITFSLHTLELYCWLHVCQPHVSIQAWIKTMCDFHNVCHRTILLVDLQDGSHDSQLTYKASIWRHFTNAFDVYLKLLRVGEQHVNKCLEHTSLDWRVKNSCPSCHYKVSVTK